MPCYLLDNFFMANPDTMIRPHPRYHELYLLRSSWSSSAREALPRFRIRDLRDLQVWSNLAWIHPLLFEQERDLAEFKAKGRHYTEDEKQWFLARQRELVARVIPLHKKLAARGQIELTTTPFYHPILPLLLEKTAAREAMPDVPLPSYRGGYPDDAAVQVRRAVESHIRHFGEPPRGMWPSEGSVSQAIIPLLARPGSDGSRPMKRSWDVRPTARSAATAGATSAIPSCSIVPGRCANRSTIWRSSSATIRCPTRSDFITSAVPVRWPPATSWPS